MYYALLFWRVHVHVKTFSSVFALNWAPKETIHSLCFKLFYSKNETLTFVVWVYKHTVFLQILRCGWKLLNNLINFKVQMFNCTKCRNVNITPFPFPRWLCPFIIFYRNVQPFLRYAIVVPYFWLWFSKTYSAWYHITTGRHT